MCRKRRGRKQNYLQAIKVVWSWCHVERRQTGGLWSSTWNAADPEVTQLTLNPTLSLWPYHNAGRISCLLHRGDIILKRPHIALGETTASLLLLTNHGIPPVPAVVSLLLLTHTTQKEDTPPTHTVKRNVMWPVGALAENVLMQFTLFHLLSYLSEI